ncbi:hypothetical protein HUU42_05770 [bacterium]|nr:hypothetical protein [bacterium]
MFDRSIYWISKSGDGYIYGFDRHGGYLGLHYPADLAVGGIRFQSSLWFAV